MTIHTQDEIVARIRARQRDDLLSFEWTCYIDALDFEHAFEFLNEEGKTKGAAGWGPVIGTREEWLAMIRDYMEFAWGKANGCRGISANRSLGHMIAWTWLAGDVEFSRELEENMEDHYQWYGKPQLVMVCEKYGIDWKALDNGVWTNGEDEEGITAARALGRET